MSSTESQSVAATNNSNDKEAKQEAPACPKCESSEDVVAIVFGYPSPGLMEKSQRGEVVLGGCCPPRPDQKTKNVHCKKCKENF